MPSASLLLPRDSLALRPFASSLPPSGMLLFDEWGRFLEFLFAVVSFMVYKLCKYFRDFLLLLFLKNSSVCHNFLCFLHLLTFFIQHIHLLHPERV